MTDKIELDPAKVIKRLEAGAAKLALRDAEIQRLGREKGKLLVDLDASYSMAAGLQAKDKNLRERIRELEAVVIRRKEQSALDHDYAQKQKDEIKRLRELLAPKMCPYSQLDCESMNNGGCICGLPKPGED